MGPRPQLAPRPAPPPTPRRPVEVVRLRNRHAPPLGSEPLPAVVLDALRSIAREMRDIPRDCVVDRAELLHWLRRMASRVDGIAALRVTLAPPKAKRLLAGSGAAPRGLAAREQAEAMFGKAPAAKPAGPRMVTDRKGRRVRVEFRRAQANGQTELRF